MSFGAIVFTNKGMALQAKAQLGQQLNFTRIAVGDGSLGAQAIPDLDALINEIKSLSLTKFKTMPGGKSVVGAVLSNQDLVTGFYWRELGLFATDPDLGEILYCYGNAGALAEYIPSPGEAEILEKQVNIIALIGNAADVSATIEQSLVYATTQDLQDLEAIVATKETPAGAQAKADGAKTQAIVEAGLYTDQEVGNLEQTVNAHLADLMPHGVIDYSTELTRTDGVLASVIEKIGGVKSTETTLTRIDGVLTSVNVKKYASDGLTITEQFTDTLTRTDGALTSVARTVV